MKRVLTLISLGTMVACAHAEPTPSGPTAGGTARLEAGTFLPLAEGNTWHFTGTLLGQPVDRTISIVGRDGPWYVDSEGERYMVDREGLRSPVRYLLRAPIEEGSSWQVVVSVSEIERYEVTATGATVNVPGGKFTGCIRVVGQTRRDKTTVLFKEDTLCPQVGWVRIRTWVDVAGRGQAEQSNLQLASFESGAPGSR